MVQPNGDGRILNQSFGYPTPGELSARSGGRLRATPQQLGSQPYGFQLDTQGRSSGTGMQRLRRDDAGMVDDGARIYPHQGQVPRASGGADRPGRRARSGSVKGSSLGLGDVSPADQGAWAQFQSYIAQVKAATAKTPPDLPMAQFAFNQALGLYQSNAYVAQQNGAYDPNALGGDQLSYANTLVQQAAGSLMSIQTEVQTTQGMSSDAITQARQDPALLAQGAINAQPDSVIAAAGSGFVQGLKQGAGDIAAGRWFFGTSPQAAIVEKAKAALAAVTDLSTPWPYLAAGAAYVWLSAPRRNPRRSRKNKRRR